MTDRDEFAKAAMNERKDKMTIDKKAYAGDVVSRLRNWRGLHLAHGGELFEEAADEIARLRLAIRRLAEQDATLSLLCKRDGSQVVTVTMDATLTAEERDDLRVWLAECLRQASTATEGGNEELAERWLGRSRRAAAMLERLG